MKEEKNPKNKKNGMTIIEVVISFTIALILVMALYSIVYWGSTGFSDLNQKLIDIGNASIFIKTELTQNAGKYFYLEPIVGTEGQYILKMKAHTPNEIFGLINQNGYNRYNKIRTIRIKEPQRMNNTNLYKVEVEIEYEHKNIIRKNAFEIYLTANSFKVAPIGFNTIESINVGTFTVVSLTNTMSTTTTSGVPITVGTVSTDLTSTITTTTTSYQPCGYVLPGGYTCARPKGHKGPHAF